MQVYDDDWSEESQMQVYDDDLHAGRRSSEVKYGELTESAIANIVRKIPDERL